MKVNQSKLTEILGEWRPARKKNLNIDALKNAERYASGCDGKRKHNTAEAALKEAKESSDYLDIYLCEFCHKWHVGKGKESHKVTTRRHRKRMKT